MSAIGPGDYVECIREPDPLPSYASISGTMPTVGAVCLVREIAHGMIQADTGEDCGGLFLAGVAVTIPIFGELGFNPKWFKPIYRRDQSVIDALKQPPKDALPDDGDVPATPKRVLEPTE